MRSRYAFPLLLVLLTAQASAQSDLCTTAILVGPGTYVADGPFSGAGASQTDATNSDWYSFDPNDPGYITVTSCGDGIRDTRVWVHTGSCGALTTLGGDDDGCPTGYPPGNSLLANVPVTPGNLYFIEWDDRWSAQGYTWDLLVHSCPNALPFFSVTDSTIDVEWVEGANGDQFSVEVGPQGFTPGTGTVVSGVLGTTPFPITVTGLTAGTDYEVYVTINCAGGGSSPFTGPWPVLTSGNPFVPNEDCGGAIPIACGDTLSGSTALAFTDLVDNCGTDVTAPGVWYSITGLTGAITVNTCAGATYDTKLNVYTGTCGALICLAGNDDACGYQSEVVFNSVATTTYYILVQGYDGEVGDFQLTASCSTCSAATDVVISATNDEADVYWTAANPNNTYSVEYGPVGFTPGTGTTVSGVYGVDGPPANLPNLTAATEYDVYIAMDCGGGDVSPLVGPVPFSTLAVPPAVNALCTDALPINCGDAVNGSTVNGIVALGPTCGGANISANGVWYSFTGTGDAITLSTCNQAAYDSKISVFTGPCNGLVCAAGNDDGNGCGTTSTITFLSQTGVDYLVLVHGYNSNNGTFTLNMTCEAPCTPAVSNDDCPNAISIIPGSIGNCIFTDSDNTCAYPSVLPNPACDPFANIQDVWFTFNSGPDATHTFTYDLGTAPTISVALYDQCGSSYISCAIDILAPVAYSGLALNTDYYLRVWNAGGTEAGTFKICDEAMLATSVNSLNDDALHVMPVPTHDLLTVEGLGNDVRTLQVFDLQGRQVMVVPVNGHVRVTMNVEGLSTGTYLLRTDGAKPVVERFVVE